jgi:Transposase DDE domain
MQERAQSEGVQQLFLGRQIYCEGAFATIKRVLGFERFWLRGLEKVQTENFGTWNAYAYSACGRAAG